MGLRLNYGGGCWQSEQFTFCHIHPSVPPQRRENKIKPLMHEDSKCRMMHEVTINIHWLITEFLLPQQSSCSQSFCWSLWSIIYTNKGFLGVNTYLYFLLETNLWRSHHRVLCNSCDNAGAERDSKIKMRQLGKENEKNKQWKRVRERLTDEKKKREMSRKVGLINISSNSGLLACSWDGERALLSLEVNE